jgi:cell division protein FtsB
MSLREGRPRTEAGLRRKALTLASVLVLVALVLGSLFGERGMLHLLSQRQKTDALARELDALRAENARLATEIAALKSDPRAIERLAREELGLAAEGESVFVIRDEPWLSGQ